MKTYTSELDSFSLISTWQCAQRAVTSASVWYIASGPTADSKGMTFPVTLPADAIINRAWVSVSVGNPATGAAYRHMNGIDIPYNGEIDIDVITAESTSFYAVFSFRANGAIYANTDVHSSVLRFDAPTLHVEYTSDSEEIEPPDENSPGNIVRTDDSGNHLPRLLDVNLHEVARIYPTKMSLDLQLRPLSTAVLTIPAGQQEIKVRDLMELFAPDGSAGIFRVAEVEDTYGHNGGQKVYLEHALATLSDSIAVGVQAMSGTFGMVVSSLLEAQTVKNWILGDVELPDEYEVVYSYSYDNLFDAIMGLTEMLPEGYAWELDTWHYPWVMHLRALNEDDFCECRLRRNLTNARVAVDTSQLCTRIYPFGSGEGTDRINLSTLTGALFADAETKDTWGIVAKTFTYEDIYDSITLQDVANRYLERHKDPTVSVILDAVALYSATGESLDRFRLGRLCRLPMNAYGIVMNERVIAIKYPDVYGQPEKAEITLANKLRTASDEIARLMREATQSKLIGGTVETTEYKNNADGITSSDPLVSYFSVEDYGNLLAARVTYTCTPEGGGEKVKANVSVDGVAINGSSSMGDTLDIFPYLKRDESGVPVVGEHYVTISPVGDDWYWAHTTITVKTIEKK